MEKLPIGDVLNRQKRAHSSQHGEDPDLSGLKGRLQSPTAGCRGGTLQRTVPAWVLQGVVAEFCEINYTIYGVEISHRDSLQRRPAATVLILCIVSIGCEIESIWHYLCIPTTIEALKTEAIVVPSVRIV